MGDDRFRIRPSSSCPFIRSGSPRRGVGGLVRRDLSAISHESCLLGLSVGRLERSPATPVGAAPEVRRNILPITGHGSRTIFPCV